MKKYTTRIVVFMLVVLSLLLVGCGMDGLSVTPKAEPTATGKPAAVAQATATVRPTNTPRPTRTPTREATATVEPTEKTNAEIIAQVVDRVMEQAPDSGTPEQRASTEDSVRNDTGKMLPELQAQGIDLSDEDDMNTFVGLVVEKAIDNGLFCWADNLGPVNETENGGAQRMEISTSGLMHLDYYRGPGIPAISVLNRAGEAEVLKGYGSQFEYPYDRCGQFDFVADVTVYAEGRRDWGHSGVIFNTMYDALNGADPIVNLWGLTPEQIDGLRPIRWEDNPEDVAAVREITGAEVNEAEAACGAARSEPHSAVPGETWTIDASNGSVIVNFWSNWENIQTPGGVEYKLFLPEGTDMTLRGGGTAYYYAEGCSNVALEQFAENGLTHLVEVPDYHKYIVQ